MAYETIALIDIVENNYNQLVETHRNLDKEIKDMYNKHSNEEDIKLQKVKKLHLKDEIAQIKDRLASLVKE